MRISSDSACDSRYMNSVRSHRQRKHDLDDGFFHWWQVSITVHCCRGVRGVRRSDTFPSCYRSILSCYRLWAFLDDLCSKRYLKKLTYWSSFKDKVNGHSFHDVEVKFMWILYRSNMGDVDIPFASKCFERTSHTDVDILAESTVTRMPQRRKTATYEIPPHFWLSSSLDASTQ